MSSEFEKWKEKNKHQLSKYCDCAKDAWNASEKVARAEERKTHIKNLDMILNFIEGWIGIEALRGENSEHPLCKVKDFINKFKGEQDE